MVIVAISSYEKNSLTSELKKQVIRLQHPADFDYEAQ